MVALVRGIGWRRLPVRGPFATSVVEVPHAPVNVSLVFSMLLKAGRFRNSGITTSWRHNPGRQASRHADGAAVPRLASGGVGRVAAQTGLLHGGSKMKRDGRTRFNFFIKKTFCMFILFTYVEPI
jgi:hypothetical protein